MSVYDEDWTPEATEEPLAPGPSRPMPRCPVCRTYEYVTWQGDEDGEYEFWCCRNHGAKGLPEVGGTVLFNEKPKEADAGSDRYDGREVDLAELLTQPFKPIPWRIENVVADGTLTVIAGEATAGKSWLGQAFCSAVVQGEMVIGLMCAQGRALYFDGEMGPQMFVNRLRPSGVVDPGYRYIDAMGLDVTRDDDLRWLKRKITEAEANLVVIDSLRRLAPSKAENDSDDMAPTVSALAKLARDTGAAIVLLHHKGESEKFYRGSTAIRDQCDALFGLLRPDGDDDGPVRCLRCGAKGKMRYAPAPRDVWLSIDPDDGSLSEADAPDGPAASLTAAAAMRDEILAALPFQTKQEAAEKVGRNMRTPAFAAAWKGLRDSRRLVRTEDASGVSAWSDSLGATQTHSPPSSNGHGHYDEQTTMAIHTERNEA
jgi:hypothetical protein